MNRNKLKAYAPRARREFIKAVTDRAVIYGLTNEKIEPVTVQGDVAIIGDKPFPKAVAEKRKRLEGRIRGEGFEQVMEAMAYTWFNRFVAIRFMELHGYLEHGYRVLSTTNSTNDTKKGKSVSGDHSGSELPEILVYAEHVDLPGLNREKVVELKLAGNRDEELYRMLLIAQCNALHKAMLFLFEEIGNATELLLPENLLHSDSLIRKMVNEIPEEEWQEVEIIGWLYQFYISEKKDQVIGKVVKSEDIPAATQLFTPNWIVKYMVQNTLGRQWVDTYPNSPLKQQMEYYIEPTEQTPEVEEQLKAITPESLNPEGLTLLDPACGSGHILVEAYDLLKTIYQERGYRAKDIPRLILEKNLYGLEIDDRAAQLAAFALVMKARADDRRIFEKNINLHILAIQETKGMDAQKITKALNTPIVKGDLPPRETLFEEMNEAHAPLFSRKNLSVKGEISQDDVACLIQLFEHGKTFGSLIRVPEELNKKLGAIAERVGDVLAYGKMFGDAAAEMLRPVVEQAQILAEIFDAVVTNPPYMGTKGMTLQLKKFGEAEYPKSKSDLFAIFVERILTLVEQNGLVGLMTPFTWMFLKSYEHLRRRVLQENTITSLIQPEYHAFFESAYVPICTFIVHRSNLKRKSEFIGLSSFYGEDLQPVKTLEAIRNPACGWRFSTYTGDFSKVPGSPVAYWVTQAVRDLFETCQPLGSLAEPKQGMATTDNNKYLRLWWEETYSSIGFFMKDMREANHSGVKWFPYNKGGEFRKWSGNYLHIVNWENDGAEIKRDVVRKYPYLNGNVGLVLKLTNPYFEKCLTWTATSSSYFGIRYSPSGFMFDVKGSSCFCDEKLIFPLLGFLASKITSYMLQALNPTIEFQNGNIKTLPISDAFSAKHFLMQTGGIVRILVGIS